MSLAAANRYARALADILLAPRRKQDPQAALERLRQFALLVGQSAELRNALLSPAVAPARKRAVVARIGAGLGIDGVLLNFLYVVIDHRRVALLARIVEAFEAVVDERMGRAGAKVSSAVPLDAVRREAIRARLERISGRQVRCEFAVEESLLGGAVARIGSTIYDGSLRGRLDALRARMVD